MQGRLLPESFPLLGTLPFDNLEAYAFRDDDESDDMDAATLFAPGALSCVSSSVQGTGATFSYPRALTFNVGFRQVRKFLLSLSQCTITRPVLEGGQVLVIPSSGAFVSYLVHHLICVWR